MLVHDSLSGRRRKLAPACNCGCSLAPGRNRTYDGDAPPGPRGPPDMDTARRGNYESGSDYVLEYGELRFTFNERDFTERVEQAAAKLGFVRARSRSTSARTSSTSRSTAR